MGQDEKNIGQRTDISHIRTKNSSTTYNDFVLEKNIFHNVFEKDIRRVYIYKKSERLAKAIHLIAPAFKDSMSLKARIDATALALVDGALLPYAGAKAVLSRELLALSSVLSIARTAGFLSAMNAEIIGREVQALLQEVAHYEEPRVSLEEVPSLAVLSRTLPSIPSLPAVPKQQPKKNVPKGHIKDSPQSNLKDRRESILSVIKDKGKVSIKDISLTIRHISEKTIQRELASLVALGIVFREGERRWSTYSLAGTVGGPNVEPAI